MSTYEEVATMPQAGVLDAAEDDIPAEDIPAEDVQEEDEFAWARDFQASYRDARTPEQRADIWTALTDDQRDELRAIGITGPVDVREDDTLNVIPPDDPRYPHVVTQARERVRVAVGQLHAGKLDVTPELAAEIGTHWEQAQKLPTNHPQYARHVQAAAHLVAKVEAERKNAVPFKASFSRGYTGPDGQAYLEERDTLGRKRVTRIEAPTEDAQASAADRLRPWGDKPSKVTLEQVATWDMATKQRFMSEQRNDFERLKQLESKARDNRMMRRRGF